MAKKKEEITETLIDAVNRELQFDGARRWGEEEDSSKFKEFLSTGSVILDTVISNERNRDLKGGIPYSGITLVAGEEQAGKTLLAGHLAVSTLKEGGIVFFLDRESGADMDYWERIGISKNEKNMVRVRIETLEEGFKAINGVLANVKRNKNTKVLIIWDSIAASMLDDDVDKDLDKVGERTYPREPRVLNEGIKRIKSIIEKHSVALVLLTQVRMNMDRINKYDVKWIIPGGQGLKHNCDVILRMNVSKGQDDDEKMKIANGITIKVIKNRIGQPGRTCKLYAYFGTGLREEICLLDRLNEIELVKKEKRTNVVEWAEGEKRFQDKKWLETLQDKKFYEWVVKTVVDSLVVNYTEEMRLRDMVGKIDMSTGEVIE